MEKEPFKFSYTMPTYDWYDTFNVTINENDYGYFRLEHRFGDKNQWWLIGIKCTNERLYREEKELGWLYSSEVKKFIEWAKTERNGSKLLEIQAISTSWNLIDLIKEELL